MCIMVSAPNSGHFEHCGGSLVNQELPKKHKGCFHEQVPRMWAGITCFLYLYFQVKENVDECDIQTYLV